MDSKRMTWEEIQQKYPSQHVGLVDVIFADNNNIVIESAIVKYTEKETNDYNLLLMAKRGEIVRRYTTLECSSLLGGINL